MRDKICNGLAASVAVANLHVMHVNCQLWCWSLVNCLGCVLTRTFGLAGWCGALWQELECLTAKYTEDLDEAAVCGLTTCAGQGIALIARCDTGSECKHGGGHVGNVHQPG